MGQYLHYYEQQAKFVEDYEGENYVEPWVSYTDEDDRTPRVDYNRRTSVKVEYRNRTEDTVYEIIEYNVFDTVDFDEMFEPVFRNFGKTGLGILLLADGAPFGYGSRCSEEFTANDINQESEAAEMPWDWRTGKFAKNMVDKTIVIEYSRPRC